MIDRDYIQVIERLRTHPAETEWLEFKKNHFEPQLLGEYLSALANSACLAGRPRGYLLFGIDGETREVIGTRFDPYTVKAKGNQDQLPWLAAGLHPNCGFETVIVDHPAGRVVVFEIGPARNQPVAFYGTPFIRVGSSKTELAKHPEKARALWMHGHDWSGEICRSAGLSDLDPDAIVKAREQFVIKHPSQSSAVREWDDLTFLNKAKVLRQGAVTHTALLLLGRPESATILAPVVAKISWILKDATNHELDYEHFGPPFLLAVEYLQKRIRNLMVRAMPSGTLFPQEMTQYDPWVIREALHNCIVHQDYSLHGRIVVVEFPDRVLLSNVGEFLPGDVEAVIRQDAPQPIYRNPFLADAMVELNMIDTQGGGIKRMFETQRRRSFPLPDYDLTEPQRVAVSLTGRILDERYTQILMERTDLILWHVMLLDRVQKRKRISRDEHKALKAAGLVEGRYPSLLIASQLAKITGQEARYILEKGFDKRYYLDLIEALVREHGPVSRKKINQLLLKKLPEVLTDKQKQYKVHNLLSELSLRGIIFNAGTRAKPQWILASSENRQPEKTNDNHL